MGWQLHDVDGGDHGALVVERPALGPRDKLRRYEIWVDGEPRGRVRAGETLRLQLTPGEHEVRAAMGRFGSPEMDVEVRPGVESQVFVGVSDKPIDVGSSGFGSAAAGDYLRLVTRRDDVPRPSLQVVGFSPHSAMVRVSMAAVLLVLLLPRQVRALGSGDGLSVVAGAAVSLFWLWIAWTIVRSGDRSGAAFWRRQIWWWTGWLGVAVAISVAALLQDRLNTPALLLYVAVPAVGALNAWALSRWMPRSDEAGV